MKIRRFVADSYKEALDKARAEMGENAMILHTRKFKEGGFLGFFARERVEITLAIEEEEKPAGGNGQARPLEAKKNQMDWPIPEKKAGGGEDAGVSQKVLEELKTMRQAVEELQARMTAEDKQKVRTRSGQTLLKKLLRARVEEKLALKIIKNVEDDMLEQGCRDLETATDLCLKEIADLIKKPKPIELKGKKTRIVALIGPTGVGKTTTIAKLAANFSLLEKKRVGLITIDTYRIAAVEQLKTYAEIIGVPLEVVFSLDDLRTAIKRLAGCDVVFIDTAGRSPRNDGQLEDLARYLKAAAPDEIILVLSVTSDGEDLVQVYDSFNVERIDKVIFTKLDETTRYGSILSVLQRRKGPISYITNGQNVPDDIEIPDEDKLARMILGEESP